MNKRFIIHFINVSCLSSLLLACQTVPKSFETQQQGTWEGRALIKNKQKNEAHILNIDISAVRNQNLRLDATTAMGLPLASLLLKEDESMYYVLYRQKKYYEGPAKAQMMRHLISINLDPKVLYNIIFDEPMANKDWVCQMDKKDLVSLCRHLRTRVEVTWDRSGERKRVNITHPDAEIQMRFSSYKTAVKDGVFELSRPESFRRLQ